MPTQPEALVQSSSRLSPRPPEPERTYLCVQHENREAGLFKDRELATFTERHPYSFQLPVLFPKTDMAAEAEQANVAGVVFVMAYGFPSRSLLRCARAILQQQRAVFFYWPEEEAVERLDAPRLRGYMVLWFFILFYALVTAPTVLLWNIAKLIRGYPRNRDGIFLPVRRADLHLPLYKAASKVQHLLKHACPAPFRGLPEEATPDCRIKGYGAYLRMDFWANNKSGGSYGHTCHVAKELAKVTENFVTFMPLRYDLLDQYGVQQVVMHPPGKLGDEQTILQGVFHYYHILKTTFQPFRPAYIYERLCLGNFVGAWLSQELGIPYILEYNGSEISMKRSFGDEPYECEAYYLQAEMLAFRQAMLISVVSQPIKDDLIVRGIPAEKIIVNPNCVDVNEYRPLAEEPKAALRRELGWEPAHCVIGFTGTFGGWHGIDVLAEAIPQICRRLPEARILLIGDGNYKHLIDEAISKHGLAGQVRCTGRVSQREGARLLGACDIYLSPHNKHMVDSRFFGSPTKVFEYLGMGGGIVASDLEQIGEVLSPALRLPDLLRDSPVSNQRAVLCKPGDVAEFVDAVVALASRPEVCRALGKNARQAACEHFTWGRHVAKLWSFYHAMARGEEKPQVHTNGNGHAKNGVHPVISPKPVNHVEATPDHEAEKRRYEQDSPWMPELLEFTHHAGADVLQIGGSACDLAQFATHGARVTMVDGNAEQLQLAHESFQRRHLSGKVVHQNADRLPFDDGTFDLVYCSEPLTRTMQPQRVAAEIHRVLRPGGKVIAIVDAKHSLRYWGNLVFKRGIHDGLLAQFSVGDILAQQGGARANRSSARIYSGKQARRLFGDFTAVRICKRQLKAADLPRWLRWLPAGLLARLIGRNLIIKATKGR